MSLKDKASRIRFPLGAATTEPQAETKTKTAPGAMMAFANDRRSEMLRENEELKRKVESSELIQSRLDETLNELRQWEGVKGARLLDPEKISRSKFANRHELNFVGAEFETLKSEISNAGGNVQPIKVRATSTKDDSTSFEIVFGHRRHEACRQLGIPVLALIDNLDDQALFVEMERENRARKDLSAWEQGIMYKRALDAGLFPSNRKLADAIGVDLGAVGKAISLAQLPHEIVSAFSSPLDLQFRWAKPLKDSYDKNPDVMVARAKKLSLLKPKLPGAAVLAALLEPSEKGLNRSTPSDELLLTSKTGFSAKISFDSKGNTLVKFTSPISKTHKEKLVKLVQEFIDKQN